MKKQESLMQESPSLRTPIEKKSKVIMIDELEDYFMANHLKFLKMSGKWLSFSILLPLPFSLMFCVGVGFYNSFNFVAPCCFFN